MSDRFVYHYCSADVFKKIVSEKTMRLSDITKSSDSIEVTYLANKFKECVLKEYAIALIENKHLNTYFPIQTFEEYVNHFYDDFFNKRQAPNLLFVFCFSEVGDLLSQWRGYADDASGFSIGFNKDTLLSFGTFSGEGSIKTNSIAFNCVNYDPEKQDTIVSIIAKDLIDRIVVFFEKEQDIDRTTPLIMSSFNEHYLCVLKESVFAKSPFFFEEKEWRLCYCWDKRDFNTSNVTSNYNFTNVDFYLRNTDFVPFLDINFTSNPEIIGEVIIGPKCHSRREEIELFLKRNGIDCVVKESKGTYR